MTSRDGASVPATETSSTTDTTLEKLSQPQFDAVQLLNDTLPPLTLTSQTSGAKSNRATLLQTASTDTQAFLSKLSTHNIRSSSELTTLTDEILRNGNRLAYEVEVLRGDANSLYDLLTDSLKEDIAQFVLAESEQNVNAASSAEHDTGSAQLPERHLTDGEPDFIRQLRTLGLVKARLEAVITTFGEAMKWPVAPSEVSMTSTLISVSAPELGVVSTPEDDKAHIYTRQLRSEITQLLESEGGGYAGLQAATTRVNQLKDLSQIWKGTVEERARNKVVDSLVKIVDDRKRSLDSKSAATARSNADGSSQRSGSAPSRTGIAGSNAAAGLFRNLQKLRDEIYLE